jgi:feruloyl esterase
VTLLVALLFAAQPAASTKAADCTALKALQLPDVRITDATPVAAGSAIKVGHCRVEGVVGREIRFRLLLPDDWNRKFVMGGGGGFVGGIDNQATGSINAGYATAGTDTGHQGAVTTAGWALNDLERQVNFGHVAIHRVTEVSKAIIRGYYGGAIARSYFAGCSNGGRQALMEAQRYPDDFDGIIAGAPAADFIGFGGRFIRDIQAAYPNPADVATPLFSAEVLKSVEAQILEKCDAVDGVKDGLLENPNACKVDVSQLARLTDAQKNALGRIYGEVKNPDGSTLFSQPIGGEGDPAGWTSWIVGPNAMVMTAQKAPSLRFAFGTEMFKNFVFADPSWDYSKYTFANFKKDTAAAASFLNATDPNLDAFKASGGKLIIWHGWSDAALSANATITYWDQVEKRDPAVRDFARLFLLPGVQHCGGGPGPSTVDWNKVLDEWVEKGTAPERVIASKAASAATATPARTRPLCAYPLRAVYNGTGSIDDETNFTCQK